MNDVLGRDAAVSQRLPFPGAPSCGCPEHRLRWAVAEAPSGLTLGRHGALHGAAHREGAATAATFLRLLKGQPSSRCPLAEPSSLCSSVSPLLSSFLTAYKWGS